MASIRDPINQIDPTNLINQAYQIGPKTYRLETNKRPDQLKILYLGCQGEEGDARDDEADLLNELCEKEQPDLIIMLGDSFYPNGIPKLPDGRFKSQFIDIYCSTKKRPALAKTPKIIIPGNHDANREHAAFAKQQASNMANLVLTRNKQINYAIGESIEINQVAYTYTQPGASDLFNRSVISTDELYDWNMPYLFHSMVIGKSHYFFLDTNSLLHDFILHQKGEYELTPTGLLKKNQFEWLQETYQRAIEAGETCFFNQHNPIDTVGKRSDPTYEDSKLYLTPEEINWLREHQSELNLNDDDINCHTRLLYKLFETKNFRPKMIFSAHDHAMCYINNTKRVSESNNPNAFVTRQVISGGGGGKFQEQKTFNQPDKVGCYLEKNGAVMLTIDPQSPDDCTLDYHTTDGKHVRFNDQSAQPIRSPECDEKAKKLRQSVLEACNQFQKSIPPPRASTLQILTQFARKNLAMDDEIHCLHELLAYLNSTTPEPYEDMLHQILLITLPLLEFNSALLLNVNKFLKINNQPDLCHHRFALATFD